MAYCYPQHVLRGLRRGAGYPSSATIDKLKTLQLFRSRGRRAGRCVQKPIRVIKSARREVRTTSHKPLRHFEVPRVWYDLPSVLMSNVTSLNNKLDEVITLVNTISPDIVAITEPWQVTSELCEIDGFSVFSRLREGRRGGGVLVWCRDTLRPSLINVNVPDEVEAVWVKASPARHPRQVASVILCVAYHPPRSPTGPTLLNHLITTVDALRGRHPNAKFVLCGDFNELDTTDVTSHLCLTQIVKFPTHGQNTLDLILTDLTDWYLPPRPLPPIGRSNHTSVLWSPSPTISHQREAEIKTLRPTPDSAIRRFGDWLVHYPWVEVLTVHDVTEKWNNYLATITHAYLHFFPTKTIRTHPKDLPWMTPRIKTIMKQRNQAFHTDQQRYRTLRNKVIREIQVAKKQYYPEKIRHLEEANTSQWFAKIRQLCGVGNRSLTLPFLPPSSPEQAAGEINNHFSAVCQSLPPLDPNSLPAYLPSPSISPTIEEFQVAKKLRSLKTRRSTTPLDLPVKLYQEFSYELATPLTSIINASLHQSVCPADWKTSYVTPIPKVTNPTSLNELRPIAITPVPSLLCEDFVFNWAYEAIHDKIDPQQFGNMKSSSTTHCLISLLDFIYQNLESRKTSTVLAFLDFRKAFDLVEHTTVITKAIKLGLPPHLTAWLTDFLSGRLQAVRYQGCTSTLQPLTCGVPQGTRMGPLTFLILINDALQDTPHRWKYVDDSTVGVTINNTAPDYAPLQNILNHLQSWTEDNHVTLNTNKTVVMHVNLATTNIPPPAVTVGTHPLQVVESARLLGVTLDNKLSWGKHVTNTVQAASYRLFMLRRLKSLGAPQKALLSMYSAFILPKLTYASQAWSSSLTITQLRSLERVQKRACKQILGSTYSTYEAALTQLNLRPLQEVFQQNLTKLAASLLTHPRHRHFLPPSIPIPPRATRHYNIIQPIRPRTNRYKFSPIPTMVRMINHLPIT